MNRAKSSAVSCACSGSVRACAGQYADHSSYNTRPMRNAAHPAMPSPMIAPISSLKYGKCH